MKHHESMVIIKKLELSYHLDLLLDWDRASDLTGDLERERDLDASRSRLSRALSTDFSRDFDRSRSALLSRDL